MNTERIKEIQKETAYPESISVQQALLKVWNECEQQKVVNKNDLLPPVINCPNCGSNNTTTSGIKPYKHYCRSCAEHWN